MAFKCNQPPQFLHKFNKTTSTQQFSRSCLISTRKNPSFMVSTTRKLSNKRIVSALISEDKVTEPSFSVPDAFKLTYLEGNSWLWEVGGANILVDPVIVGSLDFGMPFFYDATKLYLKDFQLNDLPELDCLLITQCLDDHCHLKTLKPLAQKLPNLKVIATPNAKSRLDPLFTNVIYLEPGQNSEIQTNNGTNVKIRATAGAILAPWLDSENGYIVTSPQGQSLYYEPHCLFDKETIGKEKADIVITPVIKRRLTFLEFVSGQEDAVQLAKLLNSKIVVPMKNADFDSKGVLASYIKSDGTIESFKELLEKELPDVKMLEVVPGVPLEISSTC